MVSTTAMMNIDPYLQFHCVRSTVSLLLSCGLSVVCLPCAGSHTSRVHMHM